MSAALLVELRPCLQVDNSLHPVDAGVEVRRHQLPALSAELIQQGEGAFPADVPALNVESVGSRRHLEGPPRTSVDRADHDVLEAVHSLSVIAGPSVHRGGRFRHAATQPLTGRTRDASTDFEYFMPGATVYATGARHEPSGQRTHPSCVPRYQRPSSCSTSTVRGGSNLRDSTRPTVAAAADTTAHNVMAGGP